MRLPSLLLLLCGVGALAAAVPQPTPVPTPPPSLENRAPVSIAPVSITPVSIKPVSIKPISVRTTSSCTATHTGKYGYVPPGECGALWNFSPNFGAAIFFSFLFGATMVTHVFQSAKAKTGFCWVIIMASIWEFGSYVTRSAGSRMQQNSSLATISQLLVLLAPIWVNAFDYMVFARMVHFFAPSQKAWKISPSILSFIFVSLDLFSFLIQLIGGFMATPGNSADAMQTGVHIYMGGIGIQEFFIVVFLGLIVKYHMEMLKAERSGTAKPGWKILLYALYGSLAAITVRIIFRLVEFSGGMGTDNPIPYHEAYFYVFEAVPMLAAILIWNIIHPSRSLVGPDSKLPTSWLSRKLCCCCHRNKDAKGAHRRVQTTDNEEELKGLRSREPSADRGREGSRTAQPFDYTYSNSRDPSPLQPPQPASYQPYRDPSPYRQQEFLEPPQYEAPRV